MQDNGTLTSTGGSATYSYGVWSGNGSVTISGGTLTTTGGKATDVSYGIWSSNYVNIYGGTVTATGGTATSATSRSHGVNCFASNNIHITGGLTVARSNSATTSQAMAYAPTQTDMLLTGACDETFVVYGNTSYKARTGALTFSSGSSDEGNVDSDGYCWNSGSNTLTIKNLIINAQGGGAIELPHGARLELNGQSVVKGFDSTTHALYSYGIHGTGGLTIDGEGSLIAMGGTVTKDAASYGVCSDSISTLTLNSSGLIAIGGTTTSSATSSNSYGIYGSSVTLAGGNLTAIGGTSSRISYGVHGSSVTVSSGALTAIGGTAASLYSYGMYGGASGITISDGAIAAIGGTALSNSIGMNSNHSVTVTNGATTAIGGTVEGVDGKDSVSVGILGTPSLTVENGAVSAVGDVEASSQGVWSSNVTVQHGTVTAAGGTAPLSVGVRGYLTSPVTLSGGTITASGNDCALYDVRLDFGAAPTWYMWKSNTEPAEPAGVYTHSATQQYTYDAAHKYLKVTPTVNAPVIIPTALSDGVVGTAYSKTLTATGGGSITWSVTTGTLPPDLTLNSATGVLSGTPTTAGTYTFTVTAANIAGSATRQFTLTVSDAPIPPVPPAPSGGSSTGVASGAAYSSQYTGNLALGANGAPMFTIQAPCDKLVSVIVDGVQLIRDRDYTVKCGSTIVTLTPSFLSTLKDGVHTLRVQFTDGRYDGMFTTPFGMAVTDAPTVPATGDAPLWAKILRLVVSK